MAQFVPSTDYIEKEQEYKAIKKDISTACEIIYDGLLRYKKKMLRARSKKQAEDLSVFAELDNYASPREIQDAYGWEIITETEMDRLNEMWNAREQFINSSGKFENRVTQILERAIQGCGDMFTETLDEFEETERTRKEEIKQIEKELRDSYYNWKYGNT